MTEQYLTIKVRKITHENLKNLRYELKVDTYPEVIDLLIEEHRRSLRA